ncbi:DNA polymerase III subunit gamma/tau [Verrucomicrobiota bacterium]
MSYVVLARKWRPQRFDDVVGQEHVIQTLKNAVEARRLAHAYLFVGPRGIGKTSIARIFAKALNCAEGPTVSPCGKCAACSDIATGGSLDVLEIDGASNNGVDQVRELRETVKFLPVTGSFKIYIIDEVHMLSVAAFNALLKTLEEPPQHVKFFFATTEPQKVLPTIVSRCQRFDLRRIPVPLIVERLKMIADDEKVSVEDDALLAIARGAEGALRDAESALDQLISFKGKEIAEADVLAVFGLVARSALEQLAEDILRGDVRSLIARIGAMDESGKDFERLLLELMEHFRNLLVCLNVDDPAGSLDLTEPQIEVLKKHAAMTTSGRSMRVARILMEAHERMRHTLSARTLVETELIRCSRAAGAVSLEEILKLVNDLKGRLGDSGGDAVRDGGGPEWSPPGPPPGPAGPGPAPEPEPAHPGKTEGRRGTGRAASSKRDAGPKRASASTEETPVPGHGGEGDLERLCGEWQKVSESVARVTSLLRGVLADARPLSVTENRVVIGFDPDFSDELERVEVPRNRKAVEHVVSRALGRPVVVEFTLAPGRAEADVNAVDPAGTTADDEPAEPARGRGKRSVREWMTDPAVQKAVEVFDGTVLEVRQ